ncbi:hypothetical protein GCM10011313_21280 [Mycetocola zhadangensis]|nr:hypothetical protein GCM10011313_21280 [Mycetocola zhadangensis]
MHFTGEHPEIDAVEGLHSRELDGNVFHADGWLLIDHDPALCAEGWDFGTAGTRLECPVPAVGGVLIDVISTDGRAELRSPAPG